MNHALAPKEERTHKSVVLRLDAAGDAVPDFIVDCRAISVQSAKECCG